MLFVNAKAGPSRIHGWGLLAQEFIPRGTKVWAFMPGFDVAIPEEFFGRLPPNARERAVYWSYFHTMTRTYVMSSDDDRFTNHSDDPNTRVAGDCTIAVCDIHQGDEITNDYNELSDLDFRPRIIARTGVAAEGRCNQ
jgi:SET domain-containing protein